MADKFDWDKFEDAAPQKSSPKAAKASPTESFSWDRFEDAEEPGKLESFGRGAIQGVTFGYADEISGALESAFSDKDYKTARDESRRAFDRAEKANPKSYLAGDISGGVATAFVPGLGFLNAAKGAKVASVVGKGMLQGAVSGLGRSNAEDVKDAVKDTATGAALGGAGAYVLPKVIDKAKAVGATVGKKTGNIVFGVGDEATERYLKNPDAVKNAKSLSSVTDSFLKKVDDVKKDTSFQSGEGFKELGRHIHDVATVTDPLVESATQLRVMGEIGPDRKDAIKFLEGIADDVLNLADQSGKVSLDKGKQVLFVLDSKLKKLESIGADTQAIKAVATARKNLDATLKSISPEYKKQMQTLAADTEAVSDIAGKFRTENGAERLLQRIGRGKDRFSQKALEDFDARFGTSYASDLADAAVKNQFTRETTNGSRRTVAGTAIGGAVGSLIGGPLGASIGAPIGAMAGASIDKIGGLVWQKILDGSLKAGPYAKMLENAAKRGPAAVGMTHAVLLSKFPEYRRAVDESGI